MKKKRGGLTRQCINPTEQQHVALLLIMGQRVEVNFLRLLASCERLIADDKTKRSPEIRKKLQKFAAVLAKQLETLQGGMDENTRQHRDLPRELATDYAKRVAGVSDYASHHTRGPHQNELRARLFELHPNSPRAAAETVPHEELAATGADDPIPSTHTLATLASDHQPDAEDVTDSAQATSLRYRGHAKGTGARTTGDEKSMLFGRGRAEAMTRSESDFIGQPDEETVQQVLTDDMLDIVSQLKNNSLSLGSILKDDAAKLEDLETQTDNNLQKIKGENQDLQQQLKTSSSNTTWFWIIIIFVALTFVWMVVFIKLFPKN